MFTPDLTIIINNFNHGQYLPKAIDSLVEQRCYSFEILILDDASTDDSLKVIDRYVEKYPFIRVVRREKNVGVIASANEGVDKARGTYVHTMGADDFRLPGFIEKTLGILLKNPDIGIACSDFGYISGETNEGKIQTTKLIDTIQNPMVYKAEEIVKTFQKTDFWIPGHTAIVKRESMLKYKKHDPKLHFYCDWFLLHQIALAEGAAYIPETLSVWWLHAQSYSASFLEDKQKKKKVYRHVLEILSAKENKKMSSLFMKSALLRNVMKDLFWDLFFIPKYWPFFFSIAKRNFHWHSASLKMRFLKWIKG